MSSILKTSAGRPFKASVAHLRVAWIGRSNCALAAGHSRTSEEHALISFII